MNKKIKVFLGFLGVSILAFASVGCSPVDSLKQGVNELFCSKHEYSEFVETKAPTCYANGEKERTCNNCGKVEKKEIATLEHDENNFIEFGYVPSTCTESGFLPGIKCGDENCGAVIQEPEFYPARGHLSYFVEGQGATCFVNGFTDGVFCDRCNEYIVGHEVIPAPMNHTWEYVEQVNPTCTQDGLTSIFHCAVCDENQGGEILYATGHSYKDGICNTCGRSINELTVIASQGDYNSIFSIDENQSYNYTFASVGDYIRSERVVLDTGDSLTFDFTLTASGLAPNGGFIVGFGSGGLDYSTFNETNSYYQIVYRNDCVYTFENSSVNNGWMLDNDYDSTNLQEIIIPDGIARNYRITVSYLGDGKFAYILSRFDNEDFVELDRYFVYSSNVGLSLYLSTIHSTEDYDGAGNTFSLTNINVTKTIQEL